MEDDPQYTFGERVGILIPYKVSDENLLTLRGINRDPTDTVPPFWPTLRGDDEFTITDGFVVDFEGGIANVDCLNVYYPVGIGVIGGDRIISSIDIGDFVYIKCVISPDGICTDQTLETDPADKLSFNPDPLASPRTNGEFWFKIAQLVPEAGGVAPHFKMHLAGSHILLRHRGGNLDLRVNVDHLSSGVFSHYDHHYLVFRNGDYIGKFEKTDPRPSSHGLPDEDTVTYLA
jgi:hypothetical protein